MDPVRAEAKMRELPRRIKVIAPVSFAGYPFDMAPFRRMAERHGAVLIEDASHALGGERGAHRVEANTDITTLLHFTCPVWVIVCSICSMLLVRLLNMR